MRITCNSIGKALHGLRVLIFSALISSLLFSAGGCATSSENAPPLLLTKMRPHKTPVNVRAIAEKPGKVTPLKNEKSDNVPAEHAADIFTEDKAGVAEISDIDVYQGSLDESNVASPGWEEPAKPVSVSSYENVLNHEAGSEAAAEAVLPEPETPEVPLTDSLDEFAENAGAADVEANELEVLESPVETVASLGKIKADMPQEPGEQKAIDSIPVPEVSNQELIDSALEYWQASNDFWEKGELEHAVDSLDQAYGLILKIEDTAEPELLQQKEDLRITISRRVIEVYSSRHTVANGTYKAIPLEMNAHVRKALDLFKGRNRKFFLQSYVRSGRYRPAIVKALKEAGLPEELSWLPLIESGFKLRALSSARALGMWQFIASTGHKFGLKRDAWVDERMNPAKSTMAAVAYLTELHHIFGDWTTALAAYNCGENRVLRNIKAQKVPYLDNFWDLYRKLPSETAFYVPKFLAVLHIVSDPEAHGFELPPVDSPAETRIVSINRQVSLKKIAENIDVPYKTLKTMNPELRQGVTPKALYSLSVPNDKAELLLARIDEIPIHVPPVPRYLVHRVRKGESLSGIAGRYRSSVKSIMRANGLRKRSYIKVGWKLKIPSSRYASARKAPSSTLRNKVNKTEYVVKRGDSLWKIARKHRVTVNAIKTLNGLKKGRLRIGQVLKIFADQAVKTQISGPKLSYNVKKGDSPYNIARRHNMGLSVFLALNKLTSGSTIYPGQTLVVSNERL